ncbi:MAG: hypothetical protein LT070_00065 [Solirubrobacteraceae bacterium]|nr:hypothetical protein [Solirubrobacteraceae bacterium]
MVLALSQAVKVDIGLIGVFLVFFPLLAHGLIGFAAGESVAEKRDNDRYLDEHRIPGHEA